jgi:hypothetical protein
VVDEAVDAGDEQGFADEEEVRVGADFGVVPEDVISLTPKAAAMEEMVSPAWMV